MKFLFLLVCWTTLSFSQNFSVGTYNVKNLFDLRFDGTEYDEFIPNSKQWNQSHYNAKLQSIAQVIKDSKVDILALQEVESKYALKDLLKLLPHYRYHKFLKTPKTAIGLGIISKYPLNNFHGIYIKKGISYRDILKVTVNIKGHDLTLFINHWTSKRYPESHRLRYAQTLAKAIKNENNDYLIVGDLNSNYNESQTLSHDKTLNDTHGKSGINDIIKSSSKKASNHYNLWYEIDPYKRASFYFKGTKQTPDHILLSKHLFDQDNISYIDQSFSIYHDKGSSDHYLIYAQFTTDKITHNQSKKANISSIDSIYQSHTSTHPIMINDATVLYRHKNSAIIKSNNRAIYLYKCAKGMKVGHTYNLQVDRFKEYFSLKEITKVSNIQYKTQNKQYKKLFLNATSLDLFASHYQNEILTNLKGIYKKRYLYLDSGKRIKIYTKNKKLLPPNGSRIRFDQAHLGAYKHTPQILLHKKSDFSILK
jgi:endonuclease/exonuclease/phosphatase family metal-dependent hydrolase